MEKISALIDKLQELKNTNAGLQSISYYAQLLQAEILHVRSLQREREHEQHKQGSHVAVIMPTAPLVTNTPPPVTAPAHTPAAPITTNPSPDPVSGKDPLVLPYHSTSLPKPATPPPPPPPTEPQQPVERKPAFITIYGQAQEPAPVAAPAPQPEPVMAGGSRQETNGVRKELKELNQLVAQSTPSLNDRLRQGHTELADRYSELPVKDLRSAIGINDKFQFVQELFRGDVDTYERSLKTINEFHSLQEAEYWIERELKIRQGWADDNQSVQQFYALVRKRFS
ncbi:hypothetical protein [Chitinophaga tropicalis]|uniref:Uncharacterized protein n=1 Tax=Chitinophaga tropicalis TaxID=2683588 RepID=A0A7K1U9L8_9BACT|nr:hypothetical protein [Chitinophaga tropicalis]MVT11071.1 hypothetical protein [Chitinophaga tropicalis]